MKSFACAPFFPDTDRGKNVLPSTQRAPALSVLNSAIIPHPHFRVVY